MADKYDPGAGLSDHDMIHQLWPRVGNLEDAKRDMSQRQTRLENSVDLLRAEMRTEIAKATDAVGENRKAIDATKDQLTERLDASIGGLREETSERLGSIDDHLTRQDTVLGNLRVKSARRPWTDAQKAWVAVAGVIVAAAITGVITNWHW